MRIVILSQNASPGILIFRKDFIEMLVESGCEVYALALDYNLDSKAKVSKLGAIPVDYTLRKTGLNPFYDVRDIFRLVCTLKEISPDVVCSFFVKPSMYGTFAGKIAKVPRRIAVLEGLGYIYTKDIKDTKKLRIKKIFLKILHGIMCTVSYFFAYKVLFLNPDDVVDLRKFSLISNNKMKVIGPIGLNFNDYPFSKPDLSKPIRFIFVARLLRDKGLFEFIEAARYVKKIHAKAEFVILGNLDKDNPSSLQKSQLDHIVNEGLIIYPGHVDNVGEWISQSHVFVLPSYREGFPRSTQEAMAIGRAIITTDVPGCRETVIDGHNGYIIPPMNSVILADKMLKLIECPYLINEMGLNSHYMARQNYDVKKINKVLENILLN